MKVWFTSDTHFGHTNIIRYCNRPFSTAEEMNHIIIKNFNSVVGSDDLVYHLGDFAFRNHEFYRKQLNGKHFLILGNHDDRKEVDKANFIWVRTTAGVKVNGQYIWLSHFSHRIWDRCHHGSFHLFGHSHNGVEDYGKSCDVGVDAWNFYPVSFEQLVERFKDRQNIGHH